MKPLVLMVVLLSFLAILLSNRASCADITQYYVQINQDFSAYWTIRQTGTDIQVSPETLARFQTNVTALMLAAETRTGREMAISALSVTSNVSGSYVSVEYRFVWENFSRAVNSSVIVGDVFQVNTFFNQLYGDGEVTMTYPSIYVPEKVNPPPMEQDATHQTLMWAGTRDLVNGSALITFVDGRTDLLSIFGQNEMIFLGLVALVVSGSLTYYAFNRHKKKNRLLASPELPLAKEFETDEERVVKLLESAGGALFQSAVTERCNFSKAKTSQLLTTLEGRGIVSRQRKGRDKIVVLTGRSKK